MDIVLEPGNLARVVSGSSYVDYFICTSAIGQTRKKNVQKLLPEQIA